MFTGFKKVDMIQSAGVKLKNRLPLIHLKDFVMLNEHESYYSELVMEI